jgi:hypothetical protein
VYWFYPKFELFRLVDLFGEPEFAKIFECLEVASCARCRADTGGGRIARIRFNTINCGVFLVYLQTARMASKAPLKSAQCSAPATRYEMHCC